MAASPMSHPLIVVIPIQVDNATGRLCASFVSKEEIDVGKGGEAATQDICRILMAGKLMGDVRTTGEAPLAPPSRPGTIMTDDTAVLFVLYTVHSIVLSMVRMDLSITLSTVIIADKCVCYSAEIIAIMLPVLLQLSELIAAEADPLALAKAGKLLGFLSLSCNSAAPLSP